MAVLGFALPMTVRAAVVTAFVAAIAALLWSAAQVRAHAELVESEPRDGAALTVAPSEIVATFDEPLDPSRSRLVLRDAAGEQVAAGGVDPATPGRATMRIVPERLAPGAYEVRWTAVTPDDGAVERGVIRFTTTAAASPTGTASSTIAPGTTASAAAPSALAPSAAVGPTAAPPTLSPTLSAPSPAALAAGPAGTPTSGDVLLPVLVVLVAGIALGGYLLRRRASG